MKRVAVLLLLFVLAACGSNNQLDGGTVVDKEHNPPRSTVTMTCVSYGQHGCRVWVPITSTRAEEWKLRVRGVHEGKTLTEWHDVTPLTWESADVGDEVQF